MTNIEVVPKELSELEQEAIKFAEERVENPSLDPIVPLHHFWAEFRARIGTNKQITPSERARIVEKYLDLLPKELREYLESERNGTSLLRKINNQEYLITKNIIGKDYRF